MKYEWDYYFVKGVFNCRLNTVSIVGVLVTGTQRVKAKYRLDGEDLILLTGRAAFLLMQLAK